MWSAQEFVELHDWKSDLHRGLANLNANYPGVKGADRYRHHFSLSHLASVSVTYNPRLTSYFGRAFGTTTIHLNPRLKISSEEMDWQRKETFFHELAHTMMHGENHSALWAWCFNCFGFMPLRCGTINLKAEAAQAFVNDLLED